MAELLTTIGAVLGILAFCWKVWDTLKGYLRIDVIVETSEDQIVSAKTAVENQSVRNKIVYNALLLIGPESENPIDLFNHLAFNTGFNPPVQSTNEIALIQSSKPVYDREGRAVIPLPFYYSENVRIGDERMSYRSPINTNYMTDMVPYSVRFFVCASGRLHRSTHDAFVFSSNIGSLTSTSNRPPISPPEQLDTP